jgi:predicted Zn-dependent peptidase
MIAQITPAEIQAVAQKYLNPENYALAVAGPFDGDSHDQ